MEQVAEHRNIVRSCDVMGVNVINQHNENLGTVHEIVLDKLSGQVRYVVLESGSFLGLGGKFFAIPWRVFSYDPDENAFIVNINKEQLKKAPGFDKDHWPETSDENWGHTVTNYYKTIHL